jgi:hypothetical protein
VTPAETWKRITSLVGRSERWCRDMAEREVDPLPVFKVGGTVRLNTSDYEAWIERQKRRRLTRVPVPMDIAGALAPWHGRQ